MAVIELKNVSKKFAFKFQKSALVKDFLAKIFLTRIKNYFWALEDINFQIESKEVVGIIGSNGAGKTTLLSTIAKISHPTEGEVIAKGRIYPLLTLGAGFHRELSGEDNIYLNGLLLGLSMSEIKARIERIVEFSELGSFIKMPIYTYSSGMLLRLGFAIAVEVDFDILLLDEIISVGDIAFQEKCIQKIKSFIEHGKTVIISSQSLDLLRDLCTRVVLLDKGKIRMDGEPGEVIDYYKSLKKRKESFLASGIKDELQLVRSIPEDIERIKSAWGKKFGNNKVVIENVSFLDSKFKNGIFKTGDDFTISVEAKVIEKILNPHIGVAIFRNDYHYCYGPNSKFDGIKIPEIKPQIFNFKIKYENLILNDGDYKVSVALWDNEEKDPFVYHCAYYDFKIENGFPKRGLLTLKHDWSLLTLEPLPESENIKSLDFKQVLSNIKENQKTIQDTEKRIAKVFLCDNNRRIKEIFFTGETLGVNIDVLGEDKEELFLGAALFKNDGLLCHQSGVAISSSCKRYFLRYSDLPLLRGEYYLIIFISDKKMLKIYDYNMTRFTVLSKRRDHGVVFMRHKWDISYKK